MVDCIPLLQKTLKDESSVTCKLACTAVRVSRTSNLFAPPQITGVLFVDWDPAMLRCMNMEQKITSSPKSFIVENMNSGTEVEEQTAGKLCWLDHVAV